MFFFKQKTAYEVRISDWSSDVCSSDLPTFQGQFTAVKQANKQKLAKLIKDRMGITVSPDAMFDVQIKRIHEYKRQLLNIIQAVALYDDIRAHPERNWVPRVKILAGQAAPGYWNAKLIITLDRKSVV